MVNFGFQAKERCFFGSSEGMPSRQPFTRWFLVGGGRRREERPQKQFSTRVFGGGDVDLVSEGESARDRERLIGVRRMAAGRQSKRSGKEKQAEGQR